MLTLAEEKIEVKVEESTLRMADAQRTVSERTGQRTATATTKSSSSVESATANSGSALVGILASGSTGWPAAQQQQGRKRQQRRTSGAVETGTAATLTTSTSPAVTNVRQQPR